MAGTVGDRIEAPAQRTRTGIERADDAALDGHRAIVADGRTGDHEVAVDGGRGGDEVVGTVADANPLCEIDGAAAAEVRAGLAGQRIEGQ